MAYDDARTFLQRILPWPPLGDPAAYINIHWSYLGPGYDRPAFSGRACTNINEAVNAIGFAAKGRGTQGVYVCLSTQTTMKLEQTAQGRTFKKALRDQATVKHLRSLFADIDVEDGTEKRKGKCYQDVRTALVALFQFCTDAGIPRPTLVVNSGGGIQPYWVMSAALDRETWQPLANALANAMRRYGLQADVACTVDSARLMRMPETTNIKPGRPPSKASFSPAHALPNDYTLGQMQAALHPYMGAQVLPFTPKGNQKVSSNDDLASGIEVPRAPPVVLKSMADAGCGFIAQGLRNGGKDFAQPLWNLSTLVATFTEGGRKDAHDMAMGHPTYSVETTDELFDRKLREREEKNLGWPSCEAIANAGCTACASCALRAPNTRPLQFGIPAPVQIAPPTVLFSPAATIGPTRDPLLPIGYDRTASGHITTVVNGANGTNRIVNVCPYPLLEPWLQNDPWTLHFKIRFNTSPKTIPVTVLVEQINSGEGFGKALGGHGMALDPDEMKTLRKFMSSWVKHLQDIKGGVISSNPFGWSSPAGKIEGFAFDGKVFTAGGMKSASSPGPSLQMQYTPKGDLKPWTEAAHWINSLGSPERDCFIAAAFGAPLVYPAGQPGLLISAYSSASGLGKTTALRVGQAVWGHPIKAAQGLTDTVNSVVNKIGTLKNLPMFWDELKTEEDTKRFVNLTFQLSSGKEKGRMSSDVQLRMAGDWYTLMMSASNDSLLDAVARHTKTTTAGIYRLFEYEVPPLIGEDNMTASKVDRMVLTLNENHGQAGLVYAKFLGENYQRIDQEVAAFRDNIETKFNLSKPERVWSATMAALFLGAYYANQLGLTKIDLRAFLGFLTDTLLKMRKELSAQPVDMNSELSLSNVLAQYIGSIRGKHLMRSNIVHLGGGRPAKGAVQLQGDMSRLEGLYVHIGTDNGIMRFALTPFRQWLQDKGLGPHNTLEALIQKFGAKKGYGRLGSGTLFASQTEYVLDFDLHHPELAKLTEY